MYLGCQGPRISFILNLCFEFVSVVSGALTVLFVHIVLCISHPDIHKLPPVISQVAKDLLICPMRLR